MEQTHEHIQQLLDGELDPMIESALYGKLSVDSDLRTEMRQQLALRLAVQEDRALLVPPAALTNSVFTNLGFAAPLAGAAAGAAGGGMLAQWLARFGVPVAGMLAAAGLTFGVFQATTPQSQAPSQTSSQTATHTPTTVASQADHSQQGVPTPARSVKNSSEAVPGSEAKPVVVYKTNPAMEQRVAELERENAALRSQLAANAQSQNINVTQDESPLDQEVDRVPRIATVSLHQTHGVERMADNSPYAVKALTLMQSPFAPGYTVQFRGLPLNPTIQTNAIQQSSWYDNLAVSMQYNMNANHSLLMEFANESYPMVFEGWRNGQQIRYEQFPTMFWAGLGYRYTMDQLGNSGVAPYGQLNVGGSKYGPIGRLSGGIQYSPAGAISFLFGIEASGLAYTFQDQWFLSPKIGITYGMAVRF
ncbi:MAG: hypothetical protein J5I53_10670 [Bradyrhizobiaceae bacterium]|nr:hypothetical protein [Bradyrhizobiaceae bacterium]